MRVSICGLAPLELFPCVINLFLVGPRNDLLEGNIGSSEGPDREGRATPLMELCCWWLVVAVCWRSLLGLEQVPSLLGSHEDGSLGELGVHIQVFIS